MSDQPGSEPMPPGTQTRQAVQTALSQMSPILLQNQDDTYPTLPSTVPDSQVPANAVQDNFQLLPPAAPLTVHAVHKVLDKIMSQVEGPPTQELSPSHFESLINKSRSERLPNGQDETQMTLNEGDDGHVDLLSDFDRPHDHHDQDLDSDPVQVDFSPSQSPQPLSHFPESQRFKTPATAGKKRRYNGDVVESPELPRNPLRNVGHVIGLSQAFAATQANTSPFTTNIPLPSDRPSPNIELRPRPVTVTSSPMRMIPDFQRASTEPATRYVSSKQSQAGRDELARIQLSKDFPSLADGSDDDFEDSASTSERRKREINARARAAFDTVSSPTKKIHFTPMTKSSPIRPTDRSPKTILSATSHRVIPPSSPQSDQENDSEVETEQEDNAEIAVTRSSQGYVAMDDEDKENLSEVGSQVPETTARLQHALNGSPLQIQDSPSLRPRRNHKIPNRHFADSSQPFAVADSQPSQTRKGEREYTQKSKSTGGDVVDFVPQSPTASQTQMRNGNEPDDEVDTHALPTLNSELPPVAKASSQGLQARRRSTIPETSSNERDGQHIIHSGHKQSAGNSNSTEFETAQSRLPPPPTNNSRPAIDLSSPPLSITTPPGVKRVRLQDVEAIASPQKSQSQTALSISDLFGVDHEQGEFGGSQLSVRDFHPVVVSSPRISPLINETRQAGLDEHSVVVTERQTTPEEEVEPRLQTTVTAPTSTYSRRTRKPSAKLLSTLKDKPSMEKTVQPSQWEIGASPPQKSVPVFRSVASTPKSGNPKSLRKIKSRKEWSPRSEEATISVNAVQNTTQVHDKPHVESAPPLPPAVEESSDQIEDSNEVLGENPRKISGTGAKDVPEQIHDVETVSSAKATLPARATRRQGKQKTPHQDPPRDEHPQAPEAESSTDVTRPTPGPPEPEPTLTTTAAKAAPNMVFACFNGKTKAYYPARCLGLAGSDTKRFMIEWEGFAAQEIDEYGLCSLDVRSGDMVKINQEGFPKLPHVVRGLKQSGRDTSSMSITDICGHDTVLVAPKKRKSLPADISTDSVKEVPVSALYLDSNMWRQMKDRPYEYKHEVSTAPPGTTTPADRASTPTTPTSRHRRSTLLPPASAAAPPHSHIHKTHPPPPLTSKTPSSRGGLFHGMAFAISHEEGRKNRLEGLIEHHGGQVLETSFVDLVDATTIELQPRFADLEFAALLTDQHSRKVKYMQALALGLPCLSDKWIDACIENVDETNSDGHGDSDSTRNRLVNWQPYLLAAGKSDALDDAIKSRCLPFGPWGFAAVPWSNNIVMMSSDEAMRRRAGTGTGMTPSVSPPSVSLSVQAMMATRANLLGGAHVAFVTGGKTKAAETARQHYLFFVKAMGAGVLDLHPDLKSVKASLDVDGHRAEQPVVQYCFVEDRAAVVAARKVLLSLSLQADSKIMSTAGTATASATASVSRARTSSRPPLTILCNEDIIQSLIWGQLWIK